jgi:transposase
MRKSIMYVGLDVHKDSISIAIADEGRQGEVRHYGQIDGELSSLDRIIRKLQATGCNLQFVYEAGPCGYTLYRHLAAKGFSCAVIAPSQTPRKAGDRVKCDRRDAVSLARLERAGELTYVHVPTPEDEAVRDLVRARQDAKRAETRTRQQLLALLLRNGIRYAGRTTWTAAHQRWVARLKLPLPAQQIAFQEYVSAISEAAARVERLTQQITELLPQWRWLPVVEALQALRGVALMTAVIIVAEIGDIARFQTPRQLMSYLGLTSSEYSSGPKRHAGSITKAGNSYVRRVLIESAWAYSHPARVTPILQKRLEQQVPKVREISWRAQLRLCGKYRKLAGRGKVKQQVVTAVARELVGFIWAIAREVRLAPLQAS